MDYWVSSRYNAIAIALCSLKGPALRAFIAENDIDDGELETVIMVMRMQDKEFSSSTNATFGRVQDFLQEQRRAGFNV